MKVFTRLWIVAGLLLRVLPTFADDVITNSMSPIVSYQYPDNFTSQVLSNGGIISPIASYQYFEWAGDDVLQLNSSPTVSYYYQSSSTPGSVILHGRVTDTNGSPLLGATVSVMVNQSPVAQAATDAAGNYQLPSLGAGVYNVRAVKTAYESSIRIFTLGSSTAEQNFRLKPMPGVPATLEVNRQPTVTYILGPKGSSLKVFNGTQFVPIIGPLPDVMTIVLTHGWIPLNPLTGAPVFTPNGVNDWPTTIAANLRANGVTPSIANIVAWDWKNGASKKFPPQMETPSQGVALGSNILVALTATYSRPIHFVGHSLGTMVNASAINFLHGERIPSTHAAVSLTPWSINEPPIHITLFDEASGATSDTDFAQLYFDGNTVSQTSSRLLLADNNSTLNCSPPLPRHFKWADNYVSLAGFYHANAANVLLQKGLGSHSYPQSWYRKSILNPTDMNNPLGFQQSFEYSVRNSLPLSRIPPSGLTDAYWQLPGNNELALVPIPFGLGSSVISAFGSTAHVVVHAQNNVAGTAQFAGNVIVEAVDAAQWAAQTVSQGFNYVGDIASQGGHALLDLFNSAALHVRLTTGPMTAPSQIRLNCLNCPPEANSNSISPPMIWLPLKFPTNATAMAFSFLASGNPTDDSLVCGIGTNNLYVLEAKYIPTNVSSSPLIDVKAWAGTTNELFFGFLGGTSTNATLEIANIRFYDLELPSLRAQVTNGLVTLTWPLSAGGYRLEETENLTVTNSWSQVTNDPAVVNLEYQVTNRMSEIRFYRLRQH